MVNNKKPKVFITRKIPEAGISLLSDFFEVDVWDKNLPPSNKELLSRSQGCYAVVCLLSDQIDEAYISKCPSLRIVANFAVGYNNIDLNAAKNKNIKITNTPNVLTDATADTAITLMLSASRMLIAANKNAHSGQWKTWEPMGFLGPDIRGKTLGIIGMGRIGFNVAKAMHHGFGMKIIYYSRNPKTEAEKELSATMVSLNDLASQSDFVSVHCPLTSDTEALLNKDFFDSMKREAVFVNTARGEIVDQNDLLAALKNNSIFAAGLDVTTPEPLPVDHPLYQLENCIILPHIGSATIATRKNMSLICAKNIIAHLKGETLLSEVVG